MAERVYLHLGLPKTATTYLQTIMWSDRDRMRAEGVLLPGRERRDHLWSSRIVRDAGRQDSWPEKQRTAWQRLREEIAEWPGTAVISHEFFAAASAAQAQRTIAELAPAEVHLVVTAREPLGLFAASWQEALKNRDRRRLPEYPGPVSESPHAIWNWRTLDLRLVLERWAAGVPADRVHVLPLPGRGAPRDLIWKRFATLLGLDPEAYDTGEAFPNTSMGVAEAETLRRVNEHLAERDLLTTSLERGTMIRTYLADERLVPRRGARFWPTPEQVEECRRRGEEAVAFVADQGYDVVGDLADLRVPAELPERRTVDSVTDAEVAEIATDLVAQLVGDVGALRAEVRTLRRRLDRALDPPAPLPAPVPARWRRVVNRARRTLRPGPADGAGDVAADGVGDVSADVAADVSQRTDR
jgi:hypothetical protein